MSKVQSRFCIIGLILTIQIPIFAQTTFERTYGKTTYEAGHSVQQTSDGGYIIAGFTVSLGSSDNDVYVIKTDALGDTLWIHTYGGVKMDSGHSVQQTSDGGYVIAGQSSSFGGGRSDVYLIKTDVSGNEIWAQTFGGKAYGNLNDDYGYSVQQTSDEGFIITGFTRLINALDREEDVILIKTDANGDTLWIKTYGGIRPENGRSVQQTSDGGYVIVGHTLSFGAGESDVYLIKTDDQGDTLWTRTYGGIDFDNGQSVRQTSDGGYVIVGSTSSFGVGSSDVYLIKTDENGDVLWTQTYWGINEDHGCSVQQTSDGGYVITGQSSSFGGGETDAYLIKTDALGNTLWTRNYGGADDAAGYSVQQTSDGGYVLAGLRNYAGNRICDVYLIKTDASGRTEHQKETESSFTLFQNYPNPFNHSTIIRFHLREPDYVRLNIFDLLGKELGTLINQYTQAGKHFIEWNAGDVPNGIYLYRLEAGEYVETKKMLLVE